MTAARVADGAGSFVALPPESFRLETRAGRQRLFFDRDPPAPCISSRGIEIDATFGYGAEPESVPEPLRLATKMLVALFHANRGDVIETAAAATLPAHVAALVAPYRRARLA